MKLSQETYNLIQQIPVGEDIKGNYRTCNFCAITFQIPGNIREAWTDHKEPCPVCHESYCDRGDTETRLARLQDDFQVSHEEEIMDEIFKILVSYGESLIKKKHSSVVHTEEMIEYHAFQAASYLTEKYFNDNTFTIRHSFAGYLMKLIKFSIFGKHEHYIEKENDISINAQWDDSSNKDNPIIELSSEDTYIYENSLEHEKKFTLKYILNLINEITTYAEDEEEKMILTLCLSNFFRKGPAYPDKFFRLHGRKGRELYLKAIDILKEEIKEL